MNDAQGPVEVPAFAQWKAGVTGLLGHVEAFGDARLGIQRDDFLPWTHDLAGDAPPQVKRV